MSEEGTEKIEITFTYLDKDNEPIYLLFKTLSMFLLKYYAINSTIMIELVKEKKLPLQETITKIAYIHEGYSNILLSAIKDTNGSVN